MTPRLWAAPVRRPEAEQFRAMLRASASHGGGSFSASGPRRACGCYMATARCAVGLPLCLDAEAGNQNGTSLLCAGFQGAWNVGCIPSVSRNRFRRSVIGFLRLCVDVLPAYLALVSSACQSILLPSVGLSGHGIGSRCAMGHVLGPLVRGLSHRTPATTPVAHCTRPCAAVWRCFTRVPGVMCPAF